MNINPQQNYSPIKDRTPVYFTIPEFGEKVRSGEIRDVDGTGYYANEEKISSIKVVPVQFTDEKYHSDEARQRILREGGFPPQVNLMAGGTHVAWFANEE